MLGWEVEPTFWQGVRHLLDLRSLASPSLLLVVVGVEWGQVWRGEGAC